MEERQEKKEGEGESDEFSFWFHGCRFAVKACGRFYSAWDCRWARQQDEIRRDKRRVGEVFTSAGVSVTVCMKGSHSEEKMTLLSLACFSSRQICWKLLQSVVSGERKMVLQKHNRFLVNLTGFMLNLILIPVSVKSDGDCLTCIRSLSSQTSFIIQIYEQNIIYT